MHRRVAVTGANGFVGSALALHLHGKPDVTVLGLTRRPADLKFTASAWAPDNPGQMRHALAGIDVLVHTAALAHARGVSGAEYRRVNSDLTLALAKEAAAAGVSRFVFVSSIGVNGVTTHDKPFEETDAPCPHGLYAESKLQAERGLLHVADETGLEAVVVRPPLVYGPGAPGNFAKLVRAIDRGLPLPFGRVTQNRRSYVAIDNLVSLLGLVTAHPAAANQTFLVADDEVVSTAALVRRVAAARGVRARLVPAPVGAMQAAARLAGRQEAAQRLLGDLRVSASKVREVLEWSPPVTMGQQLSRLAK